MALADTANLVVQLRLDDKLSGGLGRVSGSLRALDAAANQIGRGTRQVGQGLARVGTIAATGLAVGIGAAVKAAGDFEASLNTINTIVKLNDGDLKKLGEGIRQTFTQTGVPIDELTSAYYDLLSAGVKVEDAQSVLNTSVKLGIGGLATTKESVDLLTTAINAYGLNASGAANASDIFAAAVRDGKIVISELSASFADVAPLAAQTGVKLEEIGAAYATLTARGVEASEVGTQVNRALIELLKPGPDLVKVLKGMGIESFETSIKQKGLVQTLQDVRDEADRLGIPFQDLFGRLEAYKFALATTGPNHAKFVSELEAMGQAAGETDAQFAERQQGLNFQLGVFKAGIENAGITIGQALIPKLVPLIEKLNDFLSSNQGKIADFGQKLADGFASFADRIQTIDFSGVIEGLKLLRDIGKGVVDTFLRLPPNIQGLLVTGFALNKLSGGLLASGAGNIAGGLIKLVFERGSSPANPLWVSSATGGIGGPGGSVLAAGGRIGIGSLLGVTSAVALGAILGNEIGHAVFFDPTVKPAVEFETSQFDQLIQSNDPKRLREGLDAVERGLKDLGVGAFDPFGISGVLTNFLFGDQIKVLEDQRTLLQQILDAQPKNRRTGSRSGIEPQFLNPKRGEADLVDPGIQRLLKSLPDTAFSPTDRGNWAELPHIADSVKVLETKPSSFTANVTNIINARLSVTQALATQTVVNSIRRDYRPGDSTGGSL